MASTTAETHPAIRLDGVTMRFPTPTLPHSVSMGEVERQGARP